MTIRLLAVLGLLALCLSPAACAPGRAPLWITAYYTGWKQESLPPSEIDFSALTHLVHFSALPRPDGTLDTSTHVLSLENSRAAVALAHRAGRKVLVCLGGANTAAGFRGAMRPENRARLVQSAVGLVRSRGYDGVDLDMEPIEDADAPAFSAFTRELRAALSTVSRGGERLLLTAATSSQPEMFARLAPLFDQVNVMTYDISGPWEGWVSWHNAPLANGGVRFPNSQRSLPTVETALDPFLRAGIAPSKLGMGLAFYGTAWRGVSAPRQALGNTTTFSVTFAEVAEGKFAPAVSRWDSVAQVPYLSLDAPGAERDLFISYDNEQSISRKVAWARSRGLGGAIIWELSSGHRAEMPPGRRDPLLQAVKRAAR